MSVTRLYNKITLREHSDVSPIADPSFEKGHSFIFPGDELVMCAVFDSSTDFAGLRSQNTITSVKMSIIAKKPNVFSSEFNRIFAATRWFELDSVTIPINSLNAPLILWGADGYAQNVSFTQDRNWKLPAGDFKRQIKSFTTHQTDTDSWKYNFWFPIIFDERYWLALANADNDFYDTGEPQNGKNQKWLRYHNPSALPFGWLVKYRIELNYDHKGRAVHGSPPVVTPNTITSEWNLSNEQTGIQDYESNPDYSLLSIKTCQVDGTPSNTPALIFGDRNTSCFGYFTKQTAWDVGEKDTLVATFRIRPSEGGDRLGSRGSSVFPATSDVVWVPNTNAITTDDGDDITTDFNDILVIDNDGLPVTISFDPMDDTNVIVQAEIDYNKLGLIFPGITNFTLYCRLYNGTILLTP